jgi:hypothetical protein
MLHPTRINPVWVRTSDHPSFKGNNMDPQEKQKELLGQIVDFITGVTLASKLKPCKVEQSVTVDERYQNAKASFFGLQ